MSWWTKWRERWRAGIESTGPQSLPGEPWVLECRACGKVFESLSGRRPCPECDSGDVERVG